MITIKNYNSKELIDQYKDLLYETDVLLEKIQSTFPKLPHDLCIQVNTYSWFVDVNLSPINSYTFTETETRTILQWYRDFFGDEPLRSCTPSGTIFAMYDIRTNKDRPNYIKLHTYNLNPLECKILDQQNSEPYNYKVLVCSNEQ